MARATARRPDDRHPTAFDLRRDLMAAIPGAVAVPPEMIGELVRHVCERERRTAQLGAAQAPAAANALLPVPAETSVRSAAGEIQPRAWRNRGIVAATFVGACAIGGLVAMAIATSGSKAASSTPAQAVQAPAPPTAPPSTGQSARAASTNDELGTRSAGATLAHEPVAPQPAGPALAHEPVAAPPASDAPGGDAVRARSGETASATDADRTHAGRAASGRDANRLQPATAATVNEPADAAGSARPVRRTTSGLRSDKGRVTTVEADGAVLADEPSPPVKSPTKPKPKPAAAVRADDAVLAQ